MSLLQRPASARLTAPLAISLRTDLSPDGAASRLKEALGPAAKTTARHGDDVYLVRGSISAPSLQLVAEPAAWNRRRVGWNVQLAGNLEGSPEGGTTLRGTLDFVDEDAFRRLLQVIRFAALVPAILSIVAAVLRPGTLDPADLIRAIGFSGFAFVVAMMLGRSIEQAAAQDAAALIGIVGSMIGSTSADRP